MIYEISIVLLIIIVGYFFPLIFELKSRDKFVLRLLWLYHLMFGVIFYYYMESLGGSDSTRYWEDAKMLSSTQAIDLFLNGKSTQVMFAINYIPSNVLGLSYFTGNMIYSLFGYIGFVLFYQIAMLFIKYNTQFLGVKVFPALFFLPNLHFWSCNVGKDTLLFLAVALFAFAVIQLKKRILILVLSLIIAIFVRPHIALFLLIGFSLSFIYRNKLPLYQKLFIFTLLLAGAVLVLPKVLKITQMEEVSVESYEAFSEDKVKNLSRAHTGSSVDVSSYPFPLKLITFLFRPTIIDINSVLSLVAAMENILLLMLFIKALSFRPLQVFNAAPLVYKGLFIFLMLGSIAFSMSLGNLGIMLRMKNMFLPGMLIYIMWALSYKQVMQLRDK